MKELGTDVGSSHSSSRKNNTGSSKNTGKGKGKNKTTERVYDNAMDLDPDNISVEWQKHAAQRPDVKATVFHFTGMHADVFTITDGTSQVFFNLVKLIIDVKFPHKNFVLEVGCVFYQKVRVGPLRFGLTDPNLNMSFIAPPMCHRLAGIFPQGGHSIHQQQIAIRGPRHYHQWFCELRQKQSRTHRVCT